MVAQKHIQRATQAILKGPVHLSDLCGLKSQLEARQKFATLPEILFVGSTNVGKSSLLSSLLTPRGAPKPTLQKPRDIPNVSKKKGFTRTLNFYTVNNAVRLVDSPGYGFRSTGSQGQIMNEYLESFAQPLRQVFILAHAVKGLTDNDRSVAVMLAQRGLPFDVVLTKADICKNTSTIEQVQSDVHDLSPLADVFVTSVETNTGIDQLRGAIWRSLEV